MSTAESKEIVRRFIEGAFVRSDPPSVANLVAEQFTLNGFALTREQWLQMSTASAGILGDRQVVIEDLFAEGDRAVARCTTHAVHLEDWPVLGYGVIKRTGKPFVWRLMDMFRIADGQIVEILEESSMLEVLQQLGVLGQ